MSEINLSQMIRDKGLTWPVSVQVQLGSADLTRVWLLLDENYPDLILWVKSSDAPPSSFASVWVERAD